MSSLPAWEPADIATWAPAIVVAVLGGLATLAVAIVNGRTSPYEALADRVVGLEKSDAEKSLKISKLEAEVAQLRSDVTAGHVTRGRLRAYIVYLTHWISDHAGGIQPQPEPLPAELAED